MRRGETTIRERVWPWLRPERVVLEDSALLAIDKPSGVPSQEARQGAGDDLARRVAMYLEERDGVAPYLGIHQRLDRDTSGIVLYAKDPRANPALAAQLEGREVAKRYLAGVVGWGPAAQATLRDRLGPPRDGRVAIARDGKIAITHASVLERRGDRALLEIAIETGRTHQIRAQLAHAGAPIAGDRIYGGAPAPRLMLHASRLELVHPREDRPIAPSAPPPRVFDAWLEGRPIAIEDALELAVERRFALGRSEETNAFRLVHEEADGIPGIAADVYDDWLLLHVRGGDETPAIDALERLGFAGIYVKRHPKQANDLDDTERERCAPRQPLRGRAAPEELAIREDGIEYLVRLGDGMSTGIFLDQRENRARVRAMAGGARVLNLFSYTCAFSVAAAIGGAKATVSVDASGAALDRGRANLARSRLDPAAHRTVRADALEWLERAARRGERFDLVCCDPPTYSSTDRGRWTSGKQWRALAALCLGVLAPGGALLATSNDRRMSQHDLRRHVREAARERGIALAQLKDLGVPADFTPAIGTEPHLKGLLARRG